MPIYEYESLGAGDGCPKCTGRFEIFQGLNESPLTRCPRCGGPVRKIISWCRSAVMETPEEAAQVQQQIGDYERQGMWSHAAELADKHSEKSADKGMKMRALDNYKKAGYDVDSLERHLKTNSE